MKAPETNQARIDSFIRWMPIFRFVLPLVMPFIYLYTRIVRPKYYRYVHLSDWGWRAIKRSRLEDAEKFANELLLLSGTLPRDWNYGNAIHDGNEILGMVALKKGDVDQAKNFLIKAGSTPGSPQLNSFGPRMLLPRQLLLMGEHNVVEQYLELVSVFWLKAKPELAKYDWQTNYLKEKKARMGEWKRIIRRGGMPMDGNWAEGKKKR